MIPTDKERISAIESRLDATLPHLATKADVYKISAQLSLIAIGIVGIVVTVLKFVLEGGS